MAKPKTSKTSVKKAQKSNKKKKFSLKNLDFKKNWKKLSYLGLVGILAVSSLGYGVWKNVPQKDAYALQGTLGNLNTTPGQNMSFIGCQVYRSNPIWAKVYAWNNTSKKVTVYVAGVYMGSLNPYSSTQYYRVEPTNIVRMSDGKNTLTVYGSNIYNLRYC